MAGSLSAAALREVGSVWLNTQLATPGLTSTAGSAHSVNTMLSLQFEGGGRGAHRDEETIIL
ncbi:hypothetical protein KC19_VG113400 [Ceratodon purpureus]|uniref:Uncharacterized protein n=1 Tax=Ceratodon purpureus TaxID=3225 RepID=A0A8T0HPY5_CERPU|nr:hypothetical protein KC19_VG113400 [Ceratodon purpureus]